MRRTQDGVYVALTELRTLTLELDLSRSKLNAPKRQKTTSSAEADDVVYLASKQTKRGPQLMLKGGLTSWH